MQMHNTVLVEECIQGADFRILVSSGTMQWAFRRFPAQLVGDGRRSITHLIQDENKRRKDDRISSLPLLKSKLIKTLSIILTNRIILLIAFCQITQQLDSEALLIYHLVERWRILPNGLIKKIFSWSRPSPGSFAWARSESI